MGSLPSTAERCSGGELGHPVPLRLQSWDGRRALGCLGPALWTQAHPVPCILLCPRAQLELVMGCRGRAPTLSANWIPSSLPSFLQWGGRASNWGMAAAPSQVCRLDVVGH